MKWLGIGWIVFVCLFFPAVVVWLIVENKRSPK